jgi:hypothetical protein
VVELEILNNKLIYMNNTITLNDVPWQRARVEKLILHYSKEIIDYIQIPQKTQNKL